MAVQQTELDAFHGFSGFRVHLEQIQYRIRLVLEFDNGGLAGFNLHIDRVGGQFVPLSGFGFPHHNPLWRQVRDDDTACGVGDKGADALAAELFHLKGNAGQGFSRHTVHLADFQHAHGGVGNLNGCHFILFHHDGVGRVVQDEPVRPLDFGNNVGAGFQVVQSGVTILVTGHFTNQSAFRGGHFEGRPSQGRAIDGIDLFD